MAKPIKETPVLKGADAKKFLQNLRNSKVNKIVVADKKKIKTNFKKLDTIAHF